MEMPTLEEIRPFLTKSNDEGIDPKLLLLSSKARVISRYLTLKCKFPAQLHERPTNAAETRMEIKSQDVAMQPKWKSTMQRFL